jgi:diadenosine tetraphosphatase ApaH/serine/threonine PP2A family protein phosphatase
MHRGALNDLVYSVLQSRLLRSKKFQKFVEMESLIELCQCASAVFANEPTVLRLPANVKLVGDIHGNADDLLRIFEQCGYPPDAKYLFLGDYVDRGPYSIEVLTLLFSLKCKYPKHLYMLRGNHETSSVASTYGFLNECSRKFSRHLFLEFSEVFQNLPIAAVIDDAIFCVHGGLSPLLVDLESLEKLPKPRSLLTGVFVDLLWSDPSPDAIDFVPSPRGLGYLFSEECLNSFLDRNNLKLMIRSHESCPEGIDWSFGGAGKCVTVFSSPDYCGAGNRGAVIHVSAEHEVDKMQFKPLTESEKKKRRVIFPDWLIQEMLGGKPIDLHDRMDDGDSQPEDALRVDLGLEVLC